MLTQQPQRVPQRPPVPVWALPVLLLVPLWAVIYVGVLAQPGEVNTHDVLVLGAEVYRNNCASCHGADGRGTRVAPALADANLLLVLPDADAHLEFVREGSTAGVPYGDAGTIGTGRMPGWPTLTLDELNAVVAYERHLAGEDPPAEDNAPDEPDQNGRQRASSP